MKYLLLLLLATSSLALSIGVGTPHAVEVSEEHVAAAQFGVDALNHQRNSINTLVLQEIVAVEQQVVAGLKYAFKLKLAPSSPTGATSDADLWEVSVLSQPWKTENPMQLLSAQQLPKVDEEAMPVPVPAPAPFPAPLPVVENNDDNMSNSDAAPPVAPEIAVEPPTPDVVVEVSDDEQAELFGESDSNEQQHQHQHPHHHGPSVCNRLWNHLKTNAQSFVAYVQNLPLWVVITVGVLSGLFSIVISFLLLRRLCAKKQVRYPVVSLPSFGKHDTIKYQPLDLDEDDDILVFKGKF